MLRTCDSCDSTYDDARRWTTCPHDPIMSDANLAQKDAGLALLGKRVCFAHEPDAPGSRVQSVGWNGMVSLEGWSGEFAPSLFVEAKEPQP